LIHRALRDLSLGEVWQVLADLAFGHVVVAVLLTMASFITLTLSETIGVRSTGRRLPYRQIALTSFLALSIGHTLGFAALSSGAIRLRLYTQFGLSPGAVVQIMAMCAVTVVLGLAMLAGMSTVLNQALSGQILDLAPATTTVVGCVLFAVAAGYVIAVALAPRVLHIRDHALHLPSVRLALAQLAIGALDGLLVAGVLHQSLSAAGVDVSYLTVAIVYALATVAAIILHVPGGLGVIEAALLAVVPSAACAAALVAFRLVYYLAPFAAGCLVFAAVEWLRYGNTAPRGRLRGAPT
jgi:uncharacterized membrane protein YbhN (UPF0104 family)